MGYLTAEGGGSLEIELRYAASQQRVDKEELSTLKAQIYLLDGDFENEDWTAEEFDRKIVKPREGKGPLLKGKTDTKIEKGVGFINNRMVTVTDNSASTRTRTFRLGVRIVGSNSSGARIREAISEPFRVKDKRGKCKSLTMTQLIFIVFWVNHVLNVLVFDIFLLFQRPLNTRFHP